MSSFDAWHEWFYLRWTGSDHSWCVGATIYASVFEDDYDGFGGEW